MTDKLRKAAMKWAHDITEVGEELRDYGLNKDEMDAFIAGAEWQKNEDKSVLYHILNVAIGMIIGFCASLIVYTHYFN